uniref:tRNA(Ile)-lysidine/2-thiocytidine synthase N-terminal domain-containing protein n=1 Tax=Bos mutus grunniens TaxID=30521 RepID=A0A8B9XZJ9_BOSMU
MGTWELSAGIPQSLLEVVVLLPASALSRSLDLPAWVLFRRSRPLPPLQDPTMPAPQCASCHKARAALRRPRSGQALCGACFCAAFEAEVLHTVVAGRLLPPGAVVAVGASGGKDSTVLAHVLRELAPRLGISLHLVAVDEGIGGYRDAALAAVRRQAERWELPLTVVAYADLFGGWTMDAVARSTAGSGRSRACCTFCGVLRRRALEEGARLVGATHVVTGHNADDMAETVLMNFLRGDAGRLARGGGLGSPGEGGALPRCRPLQLASQKEVVLYAHFRRLDYFSEECVYAPEAFRGHARPAQDAGGCAAVGGAGPGALGRAPGAGPDSAAPAARRLLPLRGAGQPRALPGLRSPGRPEPRPAPPGHRQGPPGAGRGGAATGAAAVPTADFRAGPRLLETPVPRGDPAPWGRGAAYK